MVRKHETTTQIDVLADTGNTHLLAANQQSLHYTPTEPGKRLDISGMRFNRLLEDAGLQEWTGKIWNPINDGIAHSVKLDTGKRYTDGAPIQQVRWYESVLPFIESAQEASL